MFKIALMDQSDLENAYKIEQESNPTPWSRNNFFHLLMLDIILSSAKLTKN